MSSGHPSSTVDTDGVGAALEEGATAADEVAVEVASARTPPPFAGGVLPIAVGGWAAEALARPLGARVPSSQ